MSVNWRDVKAQARAIDPQWDSVERVERRAHMRREMLASVSGAQPTERIKVDPDAFVLP